MAEEKKSSLLIVPSFEYENREGGHFKEDKDLACYFSADPIKADQCRALVRDFTKQKPCQIRQCKESIVENIAFEQKDGTTEAVGLGRVHSSKRAQGEQILLYRPATGLQPTITQIDQNIFVQELDIEKVYLGLNSKYRDKLKLFTNLYRQLVELLRGQNKKLKKELEVKIEREIALTLELHANEKKLETTIVDVVFPGEGELEELRLKNSELKEQLSQTQTELENVKMQIDSCTFYLREMSTLANTETRSLINFMQTGVDLVENANLKNAEQRYEALKQHIATEKEEQKKKISEILSLQGLYVLVRIRCDEYDKSDKNNKLKYNPTPGQKFIQIGKDKLSFENAKLELWDDRFSMNALFPDNKALRSQCSQNANLYISADDIERKQNEIDRQNNNVTDSAAYRKANFSFRNWVQKCKNLIDDYFERNRYHIDQKSLEMQLIDIDDVELKEWNNYHKEKAERIARQKPSPFPDREKVTVEERKKRKMSPKEIDEENKKRKHEWIQGDKLRVQKEVRDYRSFIAEIRTNKRKEILNYQFILSSGVEYIDHSTLTFIKEQKEAELLKTITILNVGASGSGKTTTTKALLKFIFYQYTTKFPDFIDNNAKITVNFYEIYSKAATSSEKKPTIVVSTLAANVPNTNVTKYLYPYLVPTSERGNILKEDDLPQYYLCGVRPIKGDVKPIPSCEKTRAGLEAFNVMHRLMEYDDISETNREVKYTAANPTGSSRGVKVIVMKFKSSNGKNVTVNVIDTPGFEPPEEIKEGPFDPYLAKIHLAMEQDPKYVEYLSKHGGESNERNRIAQQISEEAEFILNTLEYLKDLTKKYRDLQRIKQNNPQALTEKDYEDAMTSIKQRDGSVNGKSQTNWATKTLNLFPMDSTVVVVGAFKGKIVTDNQLFGAKKTFDFLKKIIDH